MVNKELYNFRKNAGVCVRCGKPIDGESRILCIKCTKSQVNYQDSFRKKHKGGLSPLFYDKEEYYSRKKKGLCVVCGGPNDRFPLVACSVCAKMQADVGKKRRDKFKAESEAKKVKAGGVVKKQVKKPKPTHRVEDSYISRMQENQPELPITEPDRTINPTVDVTKVGPEPLKEPITRPILEPVIQEDLKPVIQEDLKPTVKTDQDSFTKGFELGRKLGRKKVYEEIDELINEVVVDSIGSTDLKKLLKLIKV